MSAPTGSAERRGGFAPAAGLLLFLLALWLPGFTSLPPMDRDEPRFAQASKQMLETGDYVAIRFGGEARNKKPVGIYWLQAAAVRAGEALGVDDARRRIWLYRVPSLLAAVATAFLTAWTALPLVSRRGAWLSGFLMGSTLLLGVEARLATTDAVVAATVAAGMGALGRAWLARGRPVPPGTAALFWAAMGVGILVKGPITPLVPALAALALSVFARSGAWLRALRPLPGLLLCLIVVAPWFVLILLRTHGAFLSEAVGHDMLGKVAGGQEMHGAPPGVYLVAFLLSGWPLAPFAVLAAPAVWRRRAEPGIAFLLAWLVPSWIVYEAVPTKLFHYTMPLYPALAILAVAALERAIAAGTPPRRVWPFAALMALVPVLVGAAVPALGGRLWALTWPVAAGAVLATACALALAAVSTLALKRGNLTAAVAAAAAAAAPVAALAFGLMLSPAVAPGVALSGRLAAAARDAVGASCPAPAYATVSDREPSLMFLTDTGLLMTDPLGAARFMDDAPCRVAFVAARDEPAFAAALDPAAGVTRAAGVDGLALNGGRPLAIGVYVRR
ncbi:ArnT family glycosyltransferase [Lichenibacterium dinghuense]|uniref:ArnT family glycosyltransferase n=1 Tax=Lichenibacterium dinghuense TaxID=2895977 RepID=UPI001F3568A3|nr:glycosyltransferase family 39 protein [Lichenibacterium sp. 6Y81]